MGSPGRHLETGSIVMRRLLVVVTRVMALKSCVHASFPSLDRDHRAVLATVSQAITTESCGFGDFLGGSSNDTEK